LKQDRQQGPPSVVSNAVSTMRAISAIIGLAFIFGASGCVSSSQKSAGVAVKLTPERFIGYHFMLISDTQVEQYNFGEDGVVLACLGTKELVTAPSLYWKIADGHTLVITDTPLGKNTMAISYQFKSFAKTNVVTTDGKQFKRE
jgi:hypothetical protein